MANYLGPNRLPDVPAGPVRLGALTWSGGPPLTRVDGWGMVVLTGGTLTNTGRTPVHVAVQALHAGGTSAGTVHDTTLAPGGTLPLAIPATAGGWMIIAETSAEARALVAGIALLGAVGIGTSVYGGYAAVRDLKARYRTHHPRR
jgi:hypothetical protein